VEATKKIQILLKALARQSLPTMRPLWIGRGGKLNSEFAGACINLVIECNVPQEKLSLALLLAYSAFFPDTPFPVRLPAPGCWTSAFTDLAAKDAVALAAAINNNPNPLHLATDSSDRKVNGTSSMHAIVASQWDDKHDKPVSIASQFLAISGPAPPFVALCPNGRSYHSSPCRSLPAASQRP
jgi:hypothetical protein